MPHSLCFPLGLILSDIVTSEQLKLPSIERRRIKEKTKRCGIKACRLMGKKAESNNRVKIQNIFKLDLLDLRQLIPAELQRKVSFRVK